MEGFWVRPRRVRRISSKPAASSSCWFQRRFSGEQLVEQHTQAVDVATRVHVHAAQLGLPGAHVNGCAHEHTVHREQGFVRQLVLQRFGDAEINDLRRRPAVQQRNKDVCRFNVSVDDSFWCACWMAWQT